MSSEVRMSGLKPSRKRFGTPPRPHFAVEPLSPVLLPAHSRPPAQVPDVAYLREIARQLSYKNNLKCDKNKPQEEKRPTIPEHTHRSHGYPAREEAVPVSPMDKLASVALGTSTSPVFGPPPRRPSDSYASPVEPYYHGMNGSATNYYPPRHDHYYDRPSKRARSEAFPSPQLVQARARPSTSHTPAGTWGYDVEKQIAQDPRSMYAANPYSQSQNELNNAHNDSERELAETLLLLGRPVRHSPSTPSLRNDSVSFASVQTNHEAPAYTQDSYDQATQHSPNIPSLATVDPSFHKYQHIEQAHVSAENVPGNPEVVSHSADHHSGTLTVQTHTPPEENLAVPDTVAEEPPLQDEKKSKTQHGWPKGKPRSSRARGAA
ncbi:hypothetical protein LTS18_011572, partial [Coniosporium uncinatum]